MDQIKIPSIEYAARRQRAVQAAQERGLAGLLVWSRGGTSVDHYGDVAYLTNHNTNIATIQDTPLWSGRGHSALILPVNDDPVLVVDMPDYRDVYLDDVRVAIHVPHAAGQVLREKGLDQAKVGLVGRYSLLFSSYQMLQESLGGSGWFEPVDDILEKMRWVKSDTEIALLRHASQVGAEWMSVMMRAVEPGKTEGEVVGEGLRYLAAMGGFPYDVAVTSGVDSQFYIGFGIPHWNSTRPLKNGDLFHIDAWGPVGNYFTDFARSTVVGQRATGAQKEILEAAVAHIGHMAAAVRPGVTFSQLYRLGADWLIENGFGGHGSDEMGTLQAETFPSFGHCLGLGLESPWVIDSETTPLQPNMVVALETFIGRPGVGGAAYEDVILVTHAGHEVLTKDCPARWWV